MISRTVRRPLPLRLLAAGAIGAAYSLTPAAPAQIGNATAEPSDAPEPRFGIFRDPAGYEGSDPDPADYNGELIEMDDGRLILSNWKGISGTEALEEDLTDDAETARDGAAGGRAAADGDRREVAVGRMTRVYLNGERAKMSDLRPGDRIMARGVDPDGSGVDRIVALRTNDFVGSDAELDIAPRDVGGRPATGAVPVDPSRAAAERNAEAGVTSPGGGGFQTIETDVKEGTDTARRLENRAANAPAGAPGDGVTVGGGGGEQLPADAEKAPGFGMVVSDSPGEGVQINDVQPGGPAADAGVRQGDFLTRLDGKTVTTPDDVKSAAKAAMPEGGDAKPVEATLWRDGQEQTVRVTPSAQGLDYFPRSNRQATANARRAGVNPNLGVRTSDYDSGSGVEVLAGAAMGALAAEAGEDGGNVRRPVGNPYSFYGNDFVDGIGPFDDGLYGGAYGYGYGGYGVTAESTTEQRLENEIVRRELREQQAEAAIGLDAEDYFPGRYPGAEAGSAPRNHLQPGDRIVGVNNNPVMGQADLNRALSSFTGDRVKLNVVRNGERKNLMLDRREAQQATGN